MFLMVLSQFEKWKWFTKFTNGNHGFEWRDSQPFWDLLKQINEILQKIQGGVDDNSKKHALVDM